ncbi:tRNA (adenosine(37)-N6)-threonylcarbamoyltransferase complex ATPase subunit type 1 TsaE [Macrococcus capreoli]|uniref:tRNA (adenosine(37)-N6)-threonylcarbamoyltransferase complex ATPase subunit type 1 TsaE n=1 Tax=Macrococcus capreoli TaxID=2982690 RepID=UPI0021D5B140|nr:tRNA (adenosine(37)-N6)-threonylcarbamoyltransferase complex ATPase subunit type 1 TsaE [Macrococcus sp. TMW 2.2395]MCU7558530.1 tRNA (adenosine(37)-N6)-threonylcarbamoyltransferase complex ATPase subunit type 1 TsaE [Macrococcus sp. TMW 2.2395]
MELLIKSIESTQKIAESIAKYSKPQTVILLKGDLGVGKTTFSQFFGQALGVTSVISSPTFNIIKSYEGRIPFHHMDCYRLESAEDDLGFDDYFYGDGVTLVEWPQMIVDFLPDDYLQIEIERIDESRRLFKINAKGPRSTNLKEQIEYETATYRYE